MTINNFKEHISQVIVDRGLKYFENGNVVLAEEVDDGVWEAAVEGSEEYTVRVKCNDSKIINRDCDCPYEDGPV